MYFLVTTYSKNFPQGEAAVNSKYDHLPPTQWINLLLFNASSRSTAVMIIEAFFKEPLTAVTNAAHIRIVLSE